MEAILRNRRAFIMIDFIIGFALLAFLGMLFTIALAKMHRNSDRLAEDRALYRDAESAMLDLQIGGATKASDIKISRIEGQAPAGKAWAELTLARQGREATLVGLVPQSAIGGNTP